MAGNYIFWWVYLWFSNSSLRFLSAYLSSSVGARGVAIFFYLVCVTFCFFECMCIPSAALLLLNGANQTLSLRRAVPGWNNVTWPAVPGCIGARSANSGIVPVQTLDAHKCRTDVWKKRDVMSGRNEMLGIKPRSNHLALKNYALTFSIIAKLVHCNMHGWTQRKVMSLIATIKCLCLSIPNVATGSHLTRQPSVI